MGKSCAWCGAILQSITSPAVNTRSDALCSGCLEELQTALSTNGLRSRESKSLRS